MVAMERGINFPSASLVNIRRVNYRFVGFVQKKLSV